MYRTALILLLVLLVAASGSGTSRQAHEKGQEESRDYQAESEPSGDRALIRQNDLRMQELYKAYEERYREDH